MEYKFQIEGRQARTIQGYKSAFADFFDASIVDIRGSRAVSSYFRDRPPVLNIHLTLGCADGSGVFKASFHLNLCL